MNKQGLALPLVHNTDLNTMGATVTVVVYEKYLGEPKLVAEQAVMVSLQRTWRLLMGYPETEVGSADFQLVQSVMSGGGAYWIFCPKARNASHADTN